MYVSSALKCLEYFVYKCLSLSVVSSSVMSWSVVSVMYWCVLECYIYIYTSILKYFRVLSWRIRVVYPWSGFVRCVLKCLGVLCLKVSWMFCLETSWVLCLDLECCVLKCREWCVFKCLERCVFSLVVLVMGCVLNWDFCRVCVWVHACVRVCACVGACVRLSLCLSACLPVYLSTLYYMVSNLASLVACVSFVIVSVDSRVFRFQCTEHCSVSLNFCILNSVSQVSVVLWVLRFELIIQDCVLCLICFFISIIAHSNTFCDVLRRSLRYFAILGCSSPLCKVLRRFVRFLLFSMILHRSLRFFAVLLGP